jgi:hypothetical protein
MVQTVKIRKGEKVIKVYFMYNDDLVDIMREHNGWWFHNEKCWQFPVNRLSEIYDDLTSKMYRVSITPLKEK